MSPVLFTVPECMCVCVIQSVTKVIILHVKVTFCSGVTPHTDLEMLEQNNSLIRSAYQSGIASLGLTDQYTKLWQFYNLAVTTFLHVIELRFLLC